MAKRKNKKFQAVIDQIDFGKLTSVVGAKIHSTYRDYVKKDEAEGWAGLGISKALRVINPAKLPTHKRYDITAVCGYIRQKGFYLALDEMRHQKVVDRKVDGVVKKTTLSTRNLSSVATEENAFGAIEHDPEDKTSSAPTKQVDAVDLFDWANGILRLQERDLLHYYYVCRLTMYHIGIILNMSEARVSQVHASILAKIRAAMPDAV
jgi:hypothetical protein